MTAEMRETGNLSLAEALAGRGLSDSAKAAIIRELARQVVLLPRTPGDALDPTTIRIELGDPVSVRIGSLFPADHLAGAGTIHPAAFYLSPEHVLGLPVDARSFEFSVAAIAYELVTGRKAFPGERLSEVLFRICSPEPPAPTEGPVSAVLERGLTRNTTLRFENAEAFAEAFSESYRAKPKAMAAAAGTGFASISGTVPVGLPPARRRRMEGIEDEPAVERPRRKRHGLIWGLVALAGIAASILLLVWKPAPNLPVQVLDTRVGPATPPPSEKSTAAQPEKGGATQPKTSASNVAAPAPVSAPVTASNPAADMVKQTPFEHPVQRPTENAAERPPVGGSSAVEFLSEPPGAHVVLDGDPAKACDAPCSMGLGAGRHTLVAELSGYGSAQRILNVPDDDTVILTMAKRTGTLVVTSNPSGASILVDGKPDGRTPLSLHLPPGQHQITVSRGADQQTEMVEVQADAIQAKSFNF